MSKDEPQSCYPSTLLRHRALAVLEKDHRFESNFIIRKDYRAGVRTEKERHRTTMEFFDNMIHSDFVLCIRGGGNFSARFYETLAMGRIPLYLETDCLLPLQENPCWESILVQANEINELPEKAFDFFHSIRNSDFNEIQIRIRSFWLNYLSIGGFFSEEIKALIDLDRYR